MGLGELEFEPNAGNDGSMARHGGKDASAGHGKAMHGAFRLCEDAAVPKVDKNEGRRGPRELPRRTTNFGEGGGAPASNAGQHGPYLDSPVTEMEPGVKEELERRLNGAATRAKWRRGAATAAAALGRGEAK
jgi:hypothetical protein